MQTSTGGLYDERGLNDFAVDVPSSQNTIKWPPKEIIVTETINSYY